MINNENSKDIGELNIQKEQTNLDILISIQKNKKENLLKCLNNINISIQNMDNIDTLNTSVQLLKNIKSCLNNIRDIIKKLEEQQILLNDDNISNTINDYNTNLDIILDDINKNSIQIENFLSQYIENSVYVPSSSINTDKNENTEKKDSEISNNTQTIDTIEEDSDDTLSDNSLLLISEKENKVFLPYTLNELQNKLSKNKNYKSIEEIINKEYIIPLDKYKNPIISRFRESYNLMKNKENASVFDSLDLALELCFNSLLNPAIISACKNLNELDIYLDCLNSNELDKFTLFEIKYDLTPKKI